MVLRLEFLSWLVLLNAVLVRLALNLTNTLTASFCKIKSSLNYIAESILKIFPCLYNYVINLPLAEYTSMNQVA